MMSPKITLKKIKTMEYMFEGLFFFSFCICGVLYTHTIYWVTTEYSPENKKKSTNEQNKTGTNKKSTIRTN